MTGPSRSVSRAEAMERVPVREYPAPMTFKVRVGSAGLDALPPMVTVVSL
jgi:hypothetical protein